MRQGAKGFPLVDIHQPGTQVYLSCFFLEQVQRNSNPYLAVVMLDKQARHRVENPKPSEGPVSPEAVQPKLTFEVNKTFLKLKHK